MENINKDSWKYNLQLLEEASNEFKFVKEFFHSTSTKNSDYGKTLELLQVYKVIEQNKKIKECVKSSNLMLFHGTSKKGVAGILETGYTNSVKGDFGRGVYLTESSDLASIYSGGRNPSPNEGRKINFMFVNEILESQKLQTVFHENLSLLTSFTRDPIYMYSFRRLLDKSHDVEFTKFVNKSKMEISEEQYKIDRLEKAEQEYRKDHLGRRYRNTAIDRKSLPDHFVADSQVTIPRFLITFERNEYQPRVKLFTPDKVKKFYR